MYIYFNIQLQYFVTSFLFTSLSVSLTRNYFFYSYQNWMIYFLNFIYLFFYFSSYFTILHKKLCASRPSEKLQQARSHLILDVLMDLLDGNCSVLAEPCSQSEHTRNYMILRVLLPRERSCLLNRDCLSRWPLLLRPPHSPSSSLKCLDHQRRAQRLLCVQPLSKGTLLWSCFYFLCCSSSEIISLNPRFRPLTTLLTLTALLPSHTRL